MYGETAEFTYDIQGEYTVNLTGSDEQGKKGCDEMVVTVLKGDRVPSFTPYGAGAIVLVAAATLTVVLIRRRKLAGQPPPQ